MASDEQMNLLQQLPAVEEVLQHNVLSAISNIPRDVVVDAVRGQIDSLRQSILAGGTPSVDVATVAQTAAARAAAAPNDLIYVGGSMYVLAELLKAMGYGKS